MIDIESNPTLNFFQFLQGKKSEVHVVNMVVNLLHIISMPLHVPTSKMDKMGACKQILWT